MAAILRPLLQFGRQAGHAVFGLLPWARHGVVAVALALCLGLTACGSNGLLSGNYVQDTAMVTQSLLTTIALTPEDPGSKEAVSQARALINDYMARYRPRPSVNGLSSFTTMQTALNSLASHYTTYTNRPLPEALRTRVRKELEQAATNASRGA
ncbi:MAG: photosystem II protein Psb27 [Cyanobacteriota bacterium]|jgi:photosystem II Psb27 protein